MDSSMKKGEHGFMLRLLFLAGGLLVMVLLTACGATAPTSTLAQPAGASPEITVYKSPT